MRDLLGNDNRKIEIPIIFLLSFALVFCTHYLFPETNAKKIESSKSTIDPYGYEFNPIKTIKMVDIVEASSIEEEIIDIKDKFKETDI